MLVRELQDGPMGPEVLRQLDDAESPMSDSNEKVAGIENLRLLVLMHLVDIAPHQPLQVARIQLELSGDSGPDDGS